MSERIGELYFSFETKESACEFIDILQAIKLKHKGITMHIGNPLESELARLLSIIEGLECDRIKYQGKTTPCGEIERRHSVICSNCRAKMEAKKENDTEMTSAECMERMEEIRKEGL